jgi:hypothetical protein
MLCDELLIKVTTEYMLKFIQWEQDPDRSSIEAKSEFKALLLHQRFEQKANKTSESSIYLFSLILLIRCLGRFAFDCTTVDEQEHQKWGIFQCKPD